MHHKVVNLNTITVEEARHIIACDRKTEWGNPFRIGPDGTREEVIAKFRRYFIHSTLYFRIGELYGKDLGCHCAPKACHCDVYVDFLNRAITSFRGEYMFLSNFYMCVVEYNGHVYKSAEHAYQSSKATNETMRRAIADSETAKDAKLLGGRVPLPKDWERNKIRTMDEILKAKFSNPFLAIQLKKTGDAPLIEVNHWGDTFWGWSGGTGRNMLGALLMKTRRYLQ